MFNTKKSITNTSSPLLSLNSKYDNANNLLKKITPIQQNLQRMPNVYQSPTNIKTPLLYITNDTKKDNIIINNDVISDDSVNKNKKDKSIQIFEKQNNIKTVLNNNNEKNIVENNNNEKNIVENNNNKKNIVENDKNEKNTINEIYQNDTVSNDINNITNILNKNKTEDNIISLDKTIQPNELIQSDKTIQQSELIQPSIDKIVMHKLSSKGQNSANINESAHINTEISEEERQVMMADGFILTHISLWEYIPINSYLRIETNNGTHKGHLQGFRSLPKQFVLKNYKMENHPYYRKTNVEFTSIIKLWKKYDDSIYIEVFLLHAAIKRQEKTINSLIDRINFIENNI